MLPARADGKKATGPVELLHIIADGWTFGSFFATNDSLDSGPNNLVTKRILLMSFFYLRKAVVLWGSKSTSSGMSFSHTRCDGEFRTGVTQLRCDVDKDSVVPVKPISFTNDW